MPGWWGLWFGALALAQEGGEPGVVTPEPAPQAEATSVAFAEALSVAKALYFHGEHDEALRQFRALNERLSAGEPVPAAAADEARLYLGEILYKFGDQAAAWDVFHAALSRQPDLLMSPYHHPTEVIAWFELVRRQVLQEIAARQPALPPVVTPVRPGRAPATVLAPFGVPQLVNGDLGAALGWGGAQLVTAGASIALYRAVDKNNHRGGWPQEDVRRAQLVQVPLSFAFYALWVGSSLEGRQAWRRAARTRSVALAPAPNGLALYAAF